MRPVYTVGMRRGTTARGMRALSALVLGIVLAGCAAASIAESPVRVAAVDPPAPGDTATRTTVDFELEGIPRTAVVEHAASSADQGSLGQSAAQKLYPALILLHGANGSSERIERMSGMTDVAGPDGFVVAYPQGTALGSRVPGFAWNAGACCGTPAAEQREDVAFIEALIEKLVADNSVDPTRIYLAGFSNGGMLAYKFVCDSQIPIAGIAVVGGAQNTGACRAPHPTRVLIVHGTGDPTVPYHGGYPKTREGKDILRWVNTSVAFAERFWTVRDSCVASAVAPIAPHVSGRTHTGCAEGTSVTVATVRGAKHEWRRTDEFDTSKLILTTFGLE